MVSPQQNVIVSDTIKAIIKYRWRVQLYVGLATFLEWDSENWEYIPVPQSLIYFYWNACILTHCALPFPFILAIYLWLKLHGTKGEPVTPIEFGTNILGWTICCTATQIIIFCYLLMKRHMDFIHLMNEIFRYCKFLEGKMHRNHLQFGPYQRKVIRELGYLVIYLAIVCTSMPIAYAGIFLNRYDPIHQLLLDVFEIDVKLELRYIKILGFMFWVLSSIGVVIFQILVLIVVYYGFANICMASLVPRNLHLHHTSQRLHKYHVETTCFGVLEDEEVVRMYRTQQMFNVLVNDIYASLLFSIHQPILMIIIVGISFVVFKIFHVVVAMGFLAPVMAFGGIFVVLFVVYLESENLGMLIEHSAAFKIVGRGFSSRRSLLWKFAVSCPILWFDLAHPFFKISRGTFCDFFCKYVDFFITLLVSRY
ncbi:unnamed protein product [Orchesella dallaii]|uniref:Odorant receptor n=1 Tax=Orchesella dallaii TaxID=48710 RepID=A0ABP1Q5P7_9HEXA